MNASMQAIARRLDLRNLGLVAFAALLGVSFSLASPHFLTFGNITNMLLTVSVIGVMAAVSTLLVVGRELDLSIGSVAALVGVGAGKFWSSRRGGAGPPASWREWRWAC